MLDQDLSNQWSGVGPIIRKKMSWPSNVIRLSMIFHIQWNLSNPNSSGPEEKFGLERFPD
jgi:hypothetical protein